MLAYRYMGELQGEHYEKDPAKFLAADEGRRSQVSVVFEWSAAGGGAPERVHCICNDATQRGVPKPQVLLTRGRRQQAEEAAALATTSTACPCRFRGVPGAPDAPIHYGTKLDFEWEHVLRADGQAHVVEI